MKINFSNGLNEPVVDQQSCLQCSLCTQVCPGWQLDIDTLRLADQAAEVVPGLGQVSASYIGCSTDHDVRFAAASGGMVTEVLIYLLEQGLVDGVVVTRMQYDNPLEAEAFIARSPEEILSARKSKYCPVAVCSLLKDVLQSDEKYAFVGLPCHVAGVRKAQLKNENLVQRLPYVLGLFCSRTPNANATKHLLYNLGIQHQAVRSIDYRGEGHPGKLRLRLKRGSEKYVEHLDYRYWGYTFLRFFKPVRCWLCPDHSAELADISFADNWTNQEPFKGDVKGSSTIVARSSHFASILIEMVRKRRVELHEIPPHIVVSSQELVAKSNVSPRLWIWKRTGRMIPDLGEYGKRQFSPKDIAAALPEFARVMATARYHHPVVVNALIRSCWLFEKGATLCFRAGRALARMPALIGAGLKALSLTREKKGEEKNKYKIVMIGGFGARDIGDEAMPHADILNLRDNISDLAIVMCSPDPEYTREFHGERAVADVTGLAYNRSASAAAKFQVGVGTLLFLLGALAERFGLHLQLWPTARSVLDELAGADLLFNVGGGNLNSLIPQELYKKCTTYLAARILKKPVIVSGQTTGPFTRKFDALYARFCLNRVDMITFRDKNTSHKRLRAIGVTRPIMADAADDAMTLPSISQEEARDLLRSLTSPSWWSLKAPLIVTMNLKGSLKLFKGEGRSSGLIREIDLMAKLADGLVQVYGAKIFFLPTDYCQGVDDREGHRDIVSCMQFASNATCVEKEYDDTTLKGIIALADIAIGARYHFAVFAASSFVPFLGIASGVYQQTKLKGLADLCGLPQCFAPDDMEFATFEQIWPKVEKVVDDREFVVQRLLKRVPLLKQRSLMAVRAATELLCSNKSHS
jgi:coenzyme F420-reducing hydrogenase beta subunit/polysaccharide pyruvyl transferase WcaK-like protein